MNWQEVCDNRYLRDLPFKIELNRWGKIEMSPTKNKHSVLQGRIQRLLYQFTKQGESFPECSIQTEDNVKVADVVWITEKRFQQVKDEDDYSIAPEICVEIVSLSNTKEEMEFKKYLYFKAGAEEFWLCDETGNMSFYNLNGQIEKSDRFPAFPDKII